MSLIRKRIITGILTVTMIVSSLQFPAYEVYAEEAIEEGIVTVEAELEGVYQFGDAPSSETSENAVSKLSIEPDIVAYEADGITAEEYIYQEALKHNPAINISAYNIEKDSISKIVSGILNDYPDLYFVNKKYSYSYSGTTVVSVKFTYDETLDDAAFKRETNKALSLIDNNMSDLQKAIILHDYLVVNCEYDKERLDTDTLPDISYTAYGVMINRIAVCQGYALAYKYLLNRVGIECYMVSSKTMNHAWNLIVLDGEFYQVDVTWDDPTWDMIGRARHTYMFHSDEVFTTVGSGHRDWEVTSGSEVVDYKADNTKYKEAFWTNVRSPLILAGDDWDDCYYAYYDANTYSGKINKATLSDMSDVGTAICDIGIWPAWNSTSFYTSVYTGLFQNGNRLYFNDKTSIYSIAFDGTDKRTEFTADTTDGYIYGSALCQGKVLYSLHQNPNLTGKETVLTADIEIQDEDSPEIPVEKIELNVDTLTLQVGETAELKATITPDDATDPTVTWKSSDPSIAEVKGGIVTAVLAGSCTIIASAGDVEAVCSVTVEGKSEEPPVIPVEDIELSADELILSKGETAELEVKIIPENATYTGITWESSNTSVAEVEDGLVTAVATGICDITCLVEFPESTGSVTCKIIVTPDEESDEIAGGSYKDITWVIDKDGKLTVEGSGDYAESVTGQVYTAPWQDYSYFIKSAEINVTGMTNAAYMFNDCSNLVSLDLKEFDTSQITDMSYMFSGCENLASLDLSSFDVSKTADMDSMFYKCSNLQTIHAPLNLTVSVELPAEPDEVWTMPDGTEIKVLPLNLSGSIIITKNKASITAEPYITVTKIKTSYVCGEELNLDDLTVTYYDGLGGASIVTDYSTNVADIDMSTEGTKELIITYNELTGTVNITVTKGTGSDDPGNPENPEKPKAEKGIRIEFADPGETHIYTGSAIIPTINVTCNGDPLTEGIDYTVKYSNNIKAGTAKVTVMGKSNLSGSASREFTIVKKRLDNKDIDSADTSAIEVEGEYVTVVEGSKISPILLYGGVKLTAKDFRVPDEYKTYKWKVEDNNKSITVTAQDNSNFTGTRALTVKVISKAEQNNNKMSVSLDNGIKNLTYDGQPKDIYKMGLITVSTKNMPSGLIKGEDYIISYPNDITSAGTKKFTVVGISDRCTGTVTKSYTIKPKKTEFTVEYDKNHRGYAFVSTGTKVDDLVVKDGNVTLMEGVHYKVSYSGNKKVGAAAKLTVTGLGNYKGSKCTKTFTINKAVINNNPAGTAAKTDGLEIVVADKVFKKAGVYKSAPYVSINGVLVKASNYMVTYYLDDPAANPNARVMDNKNNKVTNESGDTTVWVKIVGKGNYAAPDETCYATASYKVRSQGASDSYDLSKAKVTFQDKKGNPIKKIQYTGEPITGDDIKVVVTYKTGSETVTLHEGQHYTVEFVNNVNKGKATVVITGMSDQKGYVGSKTATFSIVAWSLKNLIG